MSKEEFIALIGQDVVVDYNFCGELQQWSMKNFSIKDGVIRHNRLPLLKVRSLVFLPLCLLPQLLWQKQQAPRTG